MAFALLWALECIDTKGETREEPYLCVYVNELFSETLGPFKMRRGDTIWLHKFCEGSHIGVLLSESDRHRGRFDEHYGGVEIVSENEHEADENRRERRMYSVNLPPSGKTRYKLYFYTSTDGRYPMARYCLELISLHCHDAQEYADRVFIKVDGNAEWGPRRMRTGNTVSIDPVVRIPIYDNSSIQLWEQDDKRDDYFGELHLRLGGIRTTSGHVVYNLDFNKIHRHTFSRDKGIPGSARYTLTYRIRNRIQARPPGPPRYHC